MVPRKINNTIKNKGLKCLRAPKLGQVDWQVENEEAVRRHSLGDGRSLCSAKYFKESKLIYDIS